MLSITSIKKQGKRQVYDIAVEENHHFLTSSGVISHNCLDSISTFALAPISLKFYKEAKLSGKIDNDFILPFTRVLRKGIRHDVEYTKQILDEQEKKLKELEMEIYRLAGKEFKIGSPKGLSDVLMSLGIHTGETTKSGYMKTDLEHLANANIKHPHPILDVLAEYKRLSKVLSTYVRTLYDYAKDEPENRLRYCYHLFQAPTCRLAAGKDGKNSYFTKVNIQAISKPHSKMWYVHDYKEGDKVNEGDRVVLDWRFSLTDKSDYMIEALDPHWNIRDIYLPEKNHYWVSIDFSAEELRLIANYSKEPLWVSTFLNGGDLHKSMAASIFHKEEKDVTGDERKKAKSANFGLSYGMSPYTMVGRFKLPLKECEELHKGWWGSVPHIKAYQQRTIKQAKATGTVYNYFGRPRRVKHYFRGDRRQQSFGERTCRNSPIQSMGADIFKVAFLKTYKQLLTNPKYKDHCRFLSTIHDELNLSIEYTDRKLFMEMLGIFYKCMYTKIKGWDVPFDVGLEIGTRWGDSFPFNYDPKTEVLEPDMFKVEPKEEEKEEVVQEIDTTQDKEEEEDIEIKFDIKF